MTTPHDQDATNNALNINEPWPDAPSSDCTPIVSEEELKHLTEENSKVMEKAVQKLRECYGQTQTGETL